jgi:6-phosphogluconolactonase
VTNNGDQTISIYGVIATTGQLRHIGYVLAGPDLVSMTVEPGGRFAYAANQDANNISVFRIDAITGALTSATPVPAGSIPFQVTIDPSGTFAYVTNESSNDISLYSIDETTGNLTAGTASDRGDWSCLNGDRSFSKACLCGESRLQQYLRLYD